MPGAEEGRVAANTTSISVHRGTDGLIIHIHMHLSFNREIMLPSQRAQGLGPPTKPSSKQVHNRKWVAQERHRDRPNRSGLVQRGNQGHPRVQSGIEGTKNLSRLRNTSKLEGGTEEEGLEPGRRKRGGIQVERQRRLDDLSTPLSRLGFLEDLELQMVRTTPILTMDTREEDPLLQHGANAAERSIRQGRKGGTKRLVPGHHDTAESGNHSKQQRTPASEGHQGQPDQSGAGHPPGEGGSGRWTPEGCPPQGAPHPEAQRL